MLPEAFCEVIGSPDWIKDRKFRTFVGRKENEDALNRLVGEWTVNHTAEEVMELMQRNGTASGIALTAQDLYEDPQLQHREFHWKADHRELGRHSYFGQAAKLSKAAAELRMPSPCLGEHSEYVCTEILGMAEAEFDRFLVEGAFE